MEKLTNMWILNNMLLNNLLVSMSQRRNQEGNKKYLETQENGNTMKPEILGCDSISSETEVYSDKFLY